MVTPVLSGQDKVGSETIHVVASVNKSGYVTGSVVENSDNAKVNRSLQAAVSEWRFAPAKKEGVAFDSKVRIPFNFSDGMIYTKKQSAKDRGPKVVTKSAPTRPDSLKNIRGYVNVKVAIDSEGSIVDTSVDSSSHVELEEPVISALSGWSFKPALENGEKVASTAMIPFNFRGEKGYKNAATVAVMDDREVKVLRSTFPKFSKTDIAQGAKTVVQLTVDENGYVADAEVIDSNSEVLSAQALDAIYEWKFRPAVRDGKKVAAKVSQVFVVTDGVVPSENRVTDSNAVVVKKSMPHIPETLKGVPAYVAVKLGVDENGNITDASIHESTQAAMNESALTAVQKWQFKAAKREGKSIPSKLIVPFVFNGYSS